eukprot:1993945-Rhodomonas_salina.7
MTWSAYSHGSSIQRSRSSATLAIYSSSMARAHTQPRGIVLHYEIKHQNMHFWYKLYSDCVVLSLSSGCTGSEYATSWYASQMSTWNPFSW